VLFNVYFLTGDYWASTTAGNICSLFISNHCFVSASGIVTHLHLMPSLMSCIGTTSASCIMGTGSFLGVNSSRGLTLTPHLMLMPWS